MLGRPKQTIWEGANQGFSNNFFCVLQWDIRQAASIRPCGVVPIVLRGNSTEESKFQNRFQNCINRFKLSLLLASVYKCLFNQHLRKITISKVREGERGQASTAVCATPAHSQQVIKESNRTVDLTTSISEMSARHLHTLSIQAWGRDGRSSKADTNERSLSFTCLALPGPQTPPSLSSKIHGWVKQANQLRALEQTFC